MAMKIYKVYFIEQNIRSHFNFHLVEFMFFNENLCVAPNVFHHSIVYFLFIHMLQTVDSQQWQIEWFDSIWYRENVFSFFDDAK